MSKNPDAPQADDPSGDLALQLTALRDRIERELPRAAVGPVPSTEAVGGWSKLGARLDGTLRALFEVLCAERGVAPEETWVRAFRTPYKSVTAGMVAHALTTGWLNVTAQRPRAQTLLADLRGDPSVLRGVIRLRNDFVHDRPTTRPSEVTEALVRLRDLTDRALRGA